MENTRVRGLRPVLTCGTGRVYIQLTRRNGRLGDIGDGIKEKFA